MNPLRHMWETDYMIWCLEDDEGKIMTNTLRTICGEWAKAETGSEEKRELLKLLHAQQKKMCEQFELKQKQCN